MTQQTAFDHFMSEWTNKIHASYNVPARECVVPARLFWREVFTGVQAFILGISADVMLAVYKLASY